MIKKKKNIINDIFNVSDNVFRELPVSLHYLYYNIGVKDRILNKDNIKKYINERDYYNNIIKDYNNIVKNPNGKPAKELAISFLYKYADTKAVTKAELISKKNGNDEVYNEIPNYLVTEALFDLWKQSGKITLNLDDDFISIMRHSDIKIEDILCGLKLLPYETFLIDPNFITDNGIPLFLLIHYSKDLNLLYFKYCNIKSKNGILYKKDVLYKSQSTDGIMNINDEDSIKRILNEPENDKGIVLAKALLQICTYIGCINSDIKEIPDKQIKIPTNMKTKFKPKEFILGETIGSAIRRHKQEQKTNIYLEGNGTSKTPHIRRAHFHHYWVGKGENRHTILKWIEPIFVNCRDKEDLPIKNRKVVAK